MEEDYRLCLRSLCKGRRWSLTQDRGVRRVELQVVIEIYIDFG